MKRKDTPVKPFKQALTRSTELQGQPIVKKGTVVKIEGINIFVELIDGTKVLLQGSSLTPVMESMVGVSVSFVEESGRITQILDDKACCYKKDRLCTFCMRCKVRY